MPASVLYMSMSLDGYIAGPNDETGNPGSYGVDLTGVESLTDQMLDTDLLVLASRALVVTEIEQANDSSTLGHAAMRWVAVFGWADARLAGRAWRRPHRTCRGERAASQRGH